MREIAKRIPGAILDRKVAEAIVFGARVRKLREARDWSQERLPEQSGLNTVQISHIENGRNEPKLRTILRLAKALGIRAGELIDQIKVK